MDHPKNYSLFGLGLPGYVFSFKQKKDDRVFYQHSNGRIGCLMFWKHLHVATELAVIFVNRINSSKNSS